MTKYGIMVEDTPEGGVKIEVGGMTPESGDPTSVAPSERTPAQEATVMLANFLTNAKEAEEAAKG